jgi:hypothetical protein
MAPIECRHFTKRRMVFLSLTGLESQRRLATAKYGRWAAASTVRPRRVSCELVQHAAT